MALKWANGRRCRTLSLISLNFAENPQPSVPPILHNFCFWCESPNHMKKNNPGRKTIKVIFSNLFNGFFRDRETAFNAHFDVAVMLKWASKWRVS